MPGRGEEEALGWKNTVLIFSVALSLSFPLFLSLSQTHTYIMYTQVHTPRALASGPFEFLAAGQSLRNAGKSFLNFFLFYNQCIDF